MAFFELLIIIIRNALLSIIYGYCLWKLLTLFSKFSELSKYKIMLSIFVILFVWRFSYWRNTGFGDHSRVPLTSKYEISMMDYAHADVKERNASKYLYGEAGMMEELYYEEGIVYGKTYNSYMIFDAEAGEAKLDLSKQQFENLGGDESRLLRPDRFFHQFWGWELLFF